MVESAGRALVVIDPPTVAVPGDGPVRSVDTAGLRQLGQKLSKTFAAYKSDRVIQEERWLRNLRQYLGYIDPDIESRMDPMRSKAYPKVTRIKCISTLARIMDLMFPSDDRNWTLEADPSADMKMEDVMLAIKKAQDRDQQAGSQPAPLTAEYVTSAVKEMAMERAANFSGLIDAQLQELGGDQSYDYVAINNEVVASGILYGIGVARGPYVREEKYTSWKWDEKKQQPVADTGTHYKPQFEVLNVWDYYPDLSAKRLENSDGYFTRTVMSKAQLRKLADREDFFGDVIRSYLTRMQGKGNFVQQKFESELRSMGIKQNVNEYKSETTKFEVITWHGMLDGGFLRMAGIEVPQSKVADQLEAEIWMIDDQVIKASLNPWAELNMSVRTIHTFIFDKDDTAPIGFGLPNIMRDTQMAICAATRMMMDNASVVCGPILELNTALLRADQDMTALSPWKIFYRDDEGQTAANPAVREIIIKSHIDELSKIIDMFIKFADMETFVNPMTGGDMSKMPSEPMRNAAGASMILGNAALPFKQIIRNFDKFTESMILSVVQFNVKFNEEKVKEASYQVIARGATSLIAKELRGMQIDYLSSSLTPEEKLHVDERKLVEAKFKVRDFAGMLVSVEEYMRRKSAQDQAAGLVQQLQQQNQEATTRNMFAQAYKAMTQGQKNQVTANADAVAMAMDILQKHSEMALANTEQPGSGGGTTQGPAIASGGPAVPDANQIPDPMQGSAPNSNAGLQVGGTGDLSGGGQGLPQAAQQLG